MIRFDWWICIFSQDAQITKCGHLRFSDVQYICSPNVQLFILFLTVKARHHNCIIMLFVPSNFFCSLRIPRFLLAKLQKMIVEIFLHATEERMRECARFPSTFRHWPLHHHSLRTQSHFSKKKSAQGWFVWCRMIYCIAVLKLEISQISPSHIFD